MKSISVASMAVQGGLGGSGTTRVGWRNLLGYVMGNIRRVAGDELDGWTKGQRSKSLTCGIRNLLSVRLGSPSRRARCRVARDGLDAEAP